jgi:hypothetical protein
MPFVRNLSSLMRTRENFSVGHPSQIAPSQTCLTWRFFRDRLLKKKMHLIGMDTLLILLSLGPGYHHPRGQDITQFALCKCLFTNVDVSVFISDGSLAFKGVLDDKLYLVDFTKENANLDACLITKSNMGWLWHCCLAHVGMKNLHKLLKG